MGLEINPDKMNEASLKLFKGKLENNLDALASLLGQKSFGVKQANSKVIGAELELYLVDKKGLPLAANQTVLERADDPQLTLELNRYNLEYNLSPFSIEEQPFLCSEKQICQQLSKLDGIANELEGRILPIGILPTLTPDHFGPDFMTERERYRVLVGKLVERRGKDFEIHINGETPLKMLMSDVTLEGANTSFQIHYRVNPEDFVNTYNAFQLVTPLVMAMSANSPTVFERFLWHETRIPLFKQSIDTRHKDRYQWYEPARVTFGHGWLRDSALEAFQETVRLFPPLLPVPGEEDALALVSEGGVPKLEELRLHQSTVWWWNRPVFDDADGGHLRIEMRALPAGPTAIDMMANAAFYIGLAEYYKNLMPYLLPALPFHLAEYNFYRAAQFGLDARIVWPTEKQNECSETGVLGLLESHVEKARQGLRSIDISDEEIERYMKNIEKRISRKQNGASWQRNKFRKLNEEKGVKESFSMMLQEYIELSHSNTPVSDWPIQEKS